MPVNATFGSVVHGAIYRKIPVANTAGQPWGVGKGQLGPPSQYANVTNIQL